MARTKGTGRESVPSLTDAQIGRMITRLKSHPDYRWHSSGFGAGYHIWNGHLWTDKQIMAALNLPRARYDACLLAYRKQMPRRWTPETAQKAFSAFVRKQKRWPRASDYKNWRETGLPSKRSLAYWCGGEWQLIERYATANLTSLTPEMILTIPNITVRRNMISRYGIEKLILNGGGEKFQQDDFGILWRLPSDGVDSRMVYLEVVNKTPRINEKTGKPVKNRSGDLVYDHYFLRVPPDMRTAKAAVAWTFNRSDFDGFAAES